ncbi:MAG: caspase family protein [Deltaproteobacteria bacterium]|nr:caspase family protein [Deltaproteobacteria bacterium]
MGAAERIIGDDDLALVVGVEKYRDLPASDFSAADAQLVKDYLVALGFRQRNIQLLLNDGATQSSIRKLVETWLPNRVKPASRVLVYYSGHGAPDPQSGEAYLVPYDGDPNYLADTGYPLPRLYAKLGALPVRDVAVVLDACFSGAGGRSVLAKGARPLVMMKETGSLPANLAVLAATQGGQISTSSREKGHGLLTYYFLHAINDGKRDLTEIYAAITPQVEDDARELNVSQTPSLLPEPSKLRGRFRFRN